MQNARNTLRDIFACRSEKRTLTSKYSIVERALKSPMEFVKTLLGLDSNRPLVASGLASACEDSAAELRVRRSMTRRQNELRCVLTIGGSDSAGGAGRQGDVKTGTAMGSGRCHSHLGHHSAEQFGRSSPRTDSSRQVSCADIECVFRYSCA
jgi:hypothetical protein